MCLLQVHWGKTVPFSQTVSVSTLSEKEDGSYYVDILSEKLSQLYTLNILLIEAKVVFFFSFSYIIWKTILIMDSAGIARAFI